MSGSTIEATITGVIKADIEFDLGNGFAMPVSEEYLALVQEHIGQEYTLNGYIKPDDNGQMKLFPRP